MISINKQQVTGIIIKKNDYLDNHSMIYVLTKNGIENFIVKGTKKIQSKLRLFTQSLTLVNLIVTNNLKINVVTEGFIVNNYTNIKEEPNKLLCALSVLETIDTLNASIIDYQKCFSFIERIFNILSVTNKPLSITLITHIKLWYIFGIAPNFKECCLCHSKEPLYFDLNIGGSYCIDCVKDNSLSSNLTELLKYCYFIKVENIDDTFLDIISPFNIDLFKIIEMYYQNFLDFSNKNLILIKKLF